MQETTARSKSAKWNRSFSGCATCRLRHVKCDEEKPVCTTCDQLGLECGGYDTRIIFDTDDTSSSSLFRRPLFTEEERKHMSESMVIATPPRCVLSLLSKLDVDCEKTDQQRDPSQNLQRGPFGAFSLGRDHLSSEPPNDIPVGVEFCTDDIIDDQIEQQAIELATQDPFSQDDWLTSLLMPSHVEAPSEDIGIEGVVPFDDPPLFFEAPMPMHLNIDAAIGPDKESTPTSISSIIPVLDPQSQLGEIAMLLSSFKDSVIPLLSPFKSFKSPYSVLFLPLAKEALALLVLRETPSHTPLSVLYSILATSAFSMRGCPLSQEWEHWNSRGLHFLTKAQEHLKATMSTAFHQPKVDKYKSILSAILSVIQASIFAGIWEYSEAHLLDAERFIRVKGLIKSRKSRKVRLLSHCYGYMRFFYESTFVPANLKGRNEITDAVKKAGVTAPGEDSITFCLRKWQSTLADQMIKPKTLEEGENDLHLETPGLWNNTLYSDVYDIPESILVLLSQVIRLANETQGHSTTLSWKEFSSRARDLETCICRWDHCQIIPDNNNLKDDPDINSGVVEAMHRALQKALCIYFYRRIYNVDASVLQGYVRNVKDALFKCATDATVPVGFTAAFVWPGFIAACEALDPQLQVEFGT